MNIFYSVGTAPLNGRKGTYAQAVQLPSKGRREMNRKSSVACRRGGIVLFAGVFAFVMMTSGNTALAGGGKRVGWTTVSGNGVPSVCAGEEVLALELSGAFEGCLAIFPEDFACDELDGFAWYRESGREEFDGTFEGEPGEFVTTYTFEAIFAPGFCTSFDVFSELAGGCLHHARGVSGSMRGIVGDITFFDVIPGIMVNGMITPGPDGATDFPYVGRLNRSGGNGSE